MAILSVIERSKGMFLRSVLMAGAKNTQNFPQPLADLLQFAPACCRWHSKGQRGLFALGFRPQLLARTRNGEALVIEKLLDPEYVFHVDLAVHALTGAAFRGLKLVEFSLP